MTSTFLTPEEIKAIGFASAGDNLHIDRTALFFGAEWMSLGSDIRIDAYCVLQAGEGGVELGSYIHLATGSSVGGGGGVRIEDFCGLSRNVAIYSSSDDYSGGAMTNPLVPLEFRNVVSGRVVLRKHVIVGSGSVIMPRVTIGVGAAVGALSYVNKNVPDFTVVSGNPLRRIGRRDRSLLQKEQAFLRRLTR